MSIIQFPKEPVCEYCGQNTAFAFCYLGSEIGWKFCCDCTNARDQYYMRFDSFFNSPASTVDWLAHVHHKSWMDWGNFMDMIVRFRAATGSFSQP
jgi:hypothetical protein